MEADPYTVFIPQRLRDLLLHQPVATNGVYMENCKHVRMGFHGSLEVGGGGGLKKTTVAILAFMGASDPPR